MENTEFNMEKLRKTTTLESEQIADVLERARKLTKEWQESLE